MKLLSIVRRVPLAPHAEDWLGTIMISRPLHARNSHDPLPCGKDINAAMRVPGLSIFEVLARLIHARTAVVDDWAAVHQGTLHERRYMCGLFPEPARDYLTKDM